MEDVVSVIQTMIANFGFPIACCIAMFYQQVQERKTHEEESSKWIEALNNNTQALNLIKERMRID